LERAIREKRASASITNDISQADAVIAIRSTYQTRPTKLRELNRPVATVVVKSNTFSQIAGALDELIKGKAGDKESEDAAVQEAIQAVEQVLQTGKPFDLSPQPATLRKVQHQIAESRKLASESVGQEPERRLRVLPTRLA
jgi:hypothetical protein